MHPYRVTLYVKNSLPGNVKNCLPYNVKNSLPNKVKITLPNHVKNFLPYDVKKCLTFRVFHVHGTYDRSVLTYDPIPTDDLELSFEILDGLFLVEIELELLRVKCAGCGATHILLYKYHVALPGNKELMS